MNCQKCGQPLAEGAAFCEHCGAIVEAQAVPAEPVKPVKPENVATGIVGALLGAVLGGASIVALGQLGYVSAISGFILAVCTLKGYELLGGQLTKRGIVISIVLMAITPYIADRLNWAIEITKIFAEDGATFGRAFQVVHEIIAEAGATGEYLTSLLMTYGFTALGAFASLKGLFKKKN